MTRVPIRTKLAGALAVPLARALPHRDRRGDRASLRRGRVQDQTGLARAPSGRRSDHPPPGRAQLSVRRALGRSTALVSVSVADYGQARAPDRRGPRRLAGLGGEERRDHRTRVEPAIDDLADLELHPSLVDGNTASRSMAQIPFANEISPVLRADPACFEDTERMALRGRRRRAAAWTTLVNLSARRARRFGNLARRVGACTASLGDAIDRPARSRQRTWSSPSSTGPTRSSAGRGAVLRRASAQHRPRAGRRVPATPMTPRWGARSTPT